MFALKCHAYTLTHTYKKNLPKMYLNRKKVFQAAVNMWLYPCGTCINCKVAKPKLERKQRIKPTIIVEKSIFATLKFYKEYFSIL